MAAAAPKQSTQISCTSCLDVIQVPHSAHQCPHALLRSWSKCVDCLQPTDYDSDDEAYDDEYTCTCGNPTDKAVANMEVSLQVQSTADTVDCEELPLSVSPFVGTALRDDPRCRVDESECPGARYIRLRLEEVMSWRMIAGDSGPAVRYTAVDVVDYDKVSPQIIWDKYVKHNLPVKIRGALKGWAPLEWSPERLKELAGHRDIAVRSPGEKKDGVYGNPTEAGVYTEHTISLSEFVDAAVRHPDGTCPYYAARLRLELLPELLAETPPVSPFKDCFGPQLHAGVISYMGAGGNTTPTHLDYYENSFAVVQGAKKLLLYPPNQSDLLLPRGQGCNYSTIPPNASRDDPTYPTLATTKPLEVRVEKGELLYLPFGWWHTVTGEGFNIIVNHWHDMRPEKNYASDPHIEVKS